jgi:hypothetical protein
LSPWSKRNWAGRKRNDPNAISSDAGTAGLLLVPKNGWPISERGSSRLAPTCGLGPDRAGVGAATAERRLSSIDPRSTSSRGPTLGEVLAACGKRFPFLIARPVRRPRSMEGRTFSSGSSLRSYMAGAPKLQVAVEVFSPRSSLTVRLRSRPMVLGLLHAGHPPSGGSTDRVWGIWTAMAEPPNAFSDVVSSQCCAWRRRRLDRMWTLYPAFGFEGRLEVRWTGIWPIRRRSVLTRCRSGNHHDPHHLRFTPTVCCSPAI